MSPLKINDVYRRQHSLQSKAVEYLQILFHVFQKYYGLEPVSGFSYKIVCWKTREK